MNSPIESESKIHSQIEMNSPIENNSQSGNQIQSGNQMKMNSQIQSGNQMEMNSPIQSGNNSPVQNGNQIQNGNNSPIENGNNSPVQNETNSSSQSENELEFTHFPFDPTEFPFEINSQIETFPQNDSQVESDSVVINPADPKIQKLVKRISTRSKNSRKKEDPVQRIAKLTLKYTGSQIGKAYETDAGFDLRIGKDTICPAGKPVFLEFATRISIPNGYFGLLNARSSINLKGALRTGIIDAGYIGPLKGVFIADQDIILEANSRIAQVVLIPIPTIIPEPVEELQESKRGENGFGSSGTV